MTARHLRARDSSRAFVTFCAVMAVAILVSLLLWLYGVATDLTAFIVVVGLIVATVVVFVELNRKKS